MVAGAAGAAQSVLLVESLLTATGTEPAQTLSPNTLAWNALGTVTRAI